ncbi:MAG: hypothetical protein LBT46_11280 [Planctomycetaceae bacterium]|jgi:hypothetical protein|nr:hypothetical protein [Planctomycetaceae bacterium]
MNNHFVFTLLVIVTSLVVFTGCKPSTPYDVYFVTGTVLVDGSPKEGIAVSFMPYNPEGAAANHPASGMTDVRGRYTLSTGGLGIGKGAEKGQYQVTFSHDSLDTQGMTQEEIDKKYPNGHMPVAVENLPPKYRDPSTSGFASVEVVGDKTKNVFDFQLSTEGWKKAATKQEEMRRLEPPDNAPRERTQSLN